MKKLVKILTLLALTISGTSMNAQEPKVTDYEKFVDKIIENFVSVMKEKYGLCCYGSGGSMPHDVEKIEVLFISYGTPTIENARIMEVNAIQELLSQVNSYKDIKPYLHEFPFTTDKIKISISFRTNSDDYPPTGSVATIFLSKGRLIYRSAEMKLSDPIPFSYMNEENEVVKKMIPGRWQEQLVPLMEEPYEEALKIVQSDKSGSYTEET